MRKKDNLYQAATVLVFLIVGVIVGRSRGGWPEGVLLGALGGLVVGTLISGFVIMVLGFLRSREEFIEIPGGTPPPPGAY